MKIRKTSASTTAIAAITTACAALMTMSSATLARDRDHDDGIEHVLLISVDGMHETDLERYVAGHPTSAFARLIGHGVHYTHASTSMPSDSFPGLMAFMTGGSPLSHGIFYDDSYDRTLYAPGSNCKGTPGTETLFAENLDYDLGALDGGGPAGSDHINPAKSAAAPGERALRVGLPAQFPEGQHDHGGDPRERTAHRLDRQAPRLRDRTTLVIVGTKHGQSPIDVSKLHMIRSASHPNPKATMAPALQRSARHAHGGARLVDPTIRDARFSGPSATPGGPSHQAADHKCWIRGPQRVEGIRCRT